MTAIDNITMSKVKTTEILDTAKTYYLNGDYEAAKGVILEGKEDLDSGLFHYNLGSIYLKMGKLGPARLHLEKAKKEGFSFPMLWKNLDYVKGQSQVFDPTKSKNFQEVFVGKTLDISMSGVVIFSLIVLVGLLFTLRKRVLNKVQFSILALLFGVLPISGKYLLENGYDFAIALKPTRVYEGPSKIYPDYGELPEGSRVIVGKYHDEWFYIFSPKDLAGWVERNDLAFY